MNNLELQKLFLDSPFDINDFSEEELEKIEQTKQITKKESKKVKIKLNTDKQ